MVPKPKPSTILLFGLAYFGIGFFLSQPYNMLLWLISGIMCGLASTQVLIEKCARKKDD
jgi:hypothetical protein